MAWGTPKTNWQPSDRWTYSAYNRLANNIKFVRDLAEQIYGDDIALDDMGEPKAITSIPYADEFDNMLLNTAKIIELLGTSNTAKREIEEWSFHYSTDPPTAEIINILEECVGFMHETYTNQLSNNTAPTITITSPHENWTNKASYNLVGKVTANGNGYIHNVSMWHLVNGEVVDQYTSSVNGNGMFYKTITLRRGTNNFIIRGWDEDYNPVFVRFTQSYDASVPVITITNSINDWVGTSTVAITGTVTDAESGVASLTVNGTAVTVGADGSFSKNVTLQNGSNTINVVATNGAGDKAAKTFTKSLDTARPSVSITSASGYVSQSYTLSGMMADTGSGVASVTVNGVSVPVSTRSSTYNPVFNYQFSKTYTLSEGTTTFTIVVTDKAGNSTTVTRSVTLDTQPHTATLSTALIRCTYRNSGGGTTYYTETSSSQLYEGSGVRVSTTAIYNFDVDMTQLPNYQSIKRVVINHARRRNDNNPISVDKTYYPNGAASFHVDDSDSNSNDSNGATIGWTITARARAGVNSLTYYYA